VTLRSPLQLPALTEHIQRNFTWRYYYSGEFAFAKPAVHHVRWKRVLAAAEMLARVAKPDRLLDVGCGPGESTVFLAKRFMARTAVGLELEDHPVAFARALAQANASPATFQRASARHLPFQATSFDLVVSFEMIEHLPLWKEFFAEARRVLAPGGHLLVTTPNSLGVHSMLKTAYAYVRGFGKLNRQWKGDGDFYERFLSDRTMRRGMRETGFEVVDIRHVAFVMTIQPDWTLGPSVAAERILESTPGSQRLAVTTAMLGRAV
jgi:ubiquinone/menaquinone biosynthesis C-methylase UbiE